MKTETENEYPLLPYNFIFPLIGSLIIIANSSSFWIFLIATIIMLSKEATKSCLLTILGLAIIYLLGGTTSVIVGVIIGSFRVSFEFDQKGLNGNFR